VYGFEVLRAMFGEYPVEARAVDVFAGAFRG
jgi:hypothetical protein